MARRPMNVLVIENGTHLRWTCEVCALSGFGSIPMVDHYETTGHDDFSTNAARVSRNLISVKESTL